MPKPPRVPPQRVVRAVDRVRAGLQRLHRTTAPGNIALLELATGAWTTAALYTAAKLGIADQLAAGPKHSNDVADRVGADHDGVHRLMRALASCGVLTQHADGSFTLTRVGDALRSDAEGSLRDMVLFIGHPIRWADWGNLEHSVRTGKTAFAELHGRPFFEYLETDPEFAAVFNNAMTASSGVTDEVALGAYDFSGFKLVVDVGGGHGSVLSTILRSAPQARGVLYDLPEVVADAGPTFEAAGVADRASATGGSFMDSVPDGGDLYVMKNIIHDWSDDDAATILRNIRTAMAPGGKLLLIEMVLPERANAFIGLLLDLEMLVAAGGRERTRGEYANLLSRTGFRLTHVTGTVTPLSILEAEPV
ncbi:methyltransferase [Mycolicibacterium monacense]|uniref:Hydroxyneurosporene-O-methyltransferase n=3 Tax=unclassified Mycobacterium TaxID=2642494 RepID=A0A5Q5BIY0_MYCSS|nr:methyltransferase [Mycolicibacterium monacense]MDA4104964.1 hydroxyneurosporene-O-methyltransferase [Mycolicibacterium monacense DSM 44395]OBB68758.1 hydroxyneurosporene methyltransferase [Mycolicibacterium monacense]OBF56957.1 hydroxyneurosporene methyltransferase [Mycolicibacterium monacense]ORB23859.1 hydroxyneurosporene methyltransferase [Mycolicibacterium monacense DSM 44395]QHP85880.1 hydroxyneurosporene methyltransferase [Mycolicibacterium monacense DSM 44395]